MRAALPPAGLSAPRRHPSRCPAVAAKPRALSLGLSSAGGVPSRGFRQWVRFAQEPWRLDPSAMGLGEPASSDPTFSPVQAGGGVLSTYCLLSVSVFICAVSVDLTLALCYRSPFTAEGTEAPRGGVAYPARVTQPGRGQLGVEPQPA